jgi:hypothetical protein
MNLSGDKKASVELITNQVVILDTSPYEGFGSKGFLPDSVSDIFDVESPPGKLSRKNSAPPLEILELKTSWIGSNDMLYNSRNPQVYEKSDITNNLQQSNLFLASEDKISAPPTLIQKLEAISDGGVIEGGLDQYPENMKYESVFYQESFKCGFKGKI